MLFDDSSNIGVNNVLGAAQSSGIMLNSGGAAPSTSSIASSAVTNVTVNNSGDFNARKFQVLYSRVLRLLETYLTYNKNGNYEDLNTEFTNQVYSDIAVELQQSQYYSPVALNSVIYRDQTFLDFQNRIREVNDGLFQDTILYQNSQACEARLQELEEILSDPDRLLEYFRITFEGTGNLEDLSVAVQTSTGPVIKAEYIIYIERHGFPPDGNFDSGLLAAIILELQNP